MAKKKKSAQKKKLGVKKKPARKKASVAKKVMPKKKSVAKQAAKKKPTSKKVVRRKKAVTKAVKKATGRKPASRPVASPTAARREALPKAAAGMQPLPTDITDSELIAFIDNWAALLECEDYEAAFAFTDHIPELGWNVGLIREVIKSYGDVDPNRRVTVEGLATDVTQRKQVNRGAANPDGYCGEILYDLNIDGKATDLSAVFRLRQTADGVTVHLQNVSVV